MDFITSTVLSGILYDMIKNNVLLTAVNLKARLQGWLVDDAVVQAIEKEVNALQLSDEMSERAIEKQISSSIELNRILTNIVPSSNYVVQVHSGSGDNVAGNKYNYSE